MHAANSTDDVQLSDQQQAAAAWLQQLQAWLTMPGIPRVQLQQQQAEGEGGSGFLALQAQQLSLVCSQQASGRGHAASNLEEQYVRSEHAYEWHVQQWNHPAQALPTCVNAQLILAASIMHSKAEDKLQASQCTSTRLNDVA